MAAAAAGVAGAESELLHGAVLGGKTAAEAIKVPKGLGFKVSPSSRVVALRSVAIPVATC